MDKRNSFPVVCMSIPNPQVQKRLVKEGFVFFVGTYRLEDVCPDRVVVLLPAGWKLEHGSVANLIFDEDRQPRYLDFLPSAGEFKFTVLPITIPPKILRRLERSRDGRIVTSGIPMDQILCLPHTALAIHDNRNFAAAFMGEFAN